MIFDIDDLIHRHREFCEDSFEPYIKLLSRIVWKSIDASGRDLIFLIFYVFFDFLTENRTESGHTYVIEGTD